MTRLQTTQGTLARRGFLDAAAALEALTDWHADQETVLDLLVRSADPDLALAGLSRLYEQQPGLGLTVRKYVLWKRGALASPTLRAPVPRLSPETRAEVDWLLERLERRLGAG